MLLCSRIARDIHQPITVIMKMPLSELNAWADVYRYEAEIMNGETEDGSADDDTDAEINPRDVFRMLNAEVK